MNAAQIEMLISIAQGNYLPSTNHAVIANLARLYRRGYIRYGVTSVELTALGSDVLKLQKAGA